MRAMVAAAVVMFAGPVAAQPSARPSAPPAASSSARPPARSTAATQPLARSWLGIGIRNGFTGVVVSEVIPGTPARDAGLLAGDEIIAVAGNRIANSAALSSDIGARVAGQEIEVQVLRRGRRLRLPVVVDLLPGESDILALRLGNRPAPRFSLPVVRGRSGRLQDYRGTVVVLLFWSTWDMRSVSLLLPLAKLALEFGSGDLQVIGLSADAVKTQRGFLAKNKVPFTLLRDPRGNVRTGVYRSNALSTLVVIDRRGVVRYAGIGAAQNVDLAAFTARRAVRTR